jgi:fluoroacetyl-CoA thioesterase
VAVTTMIDAIQYISPGTNAIVQRTVEKKHTEHNYGGGAWDDLLATPAYVDMMIRAAIKAVDHNLPEGFTTVGRSMEFTHEAPTGTGMSVSIQATVTEVKGNRILFDIIASDELGGIGRGKHERVVVNRNEWMKKVNEHLKPVQRIDFK